MAPIRGTDGLIQVGPSNAPTEVGKVTQFEINRTRAITTSGPYVNEDLIEKAYGAKDFTATLTYQMPSGRDNGQDAIDDAFEAGTTLRILLQTDGGKTFTVPNALITEAPISQEAAGIVTGTFGMTPQGDYDVTDTA